MYNSPYFNTYSPQANIDRINSQIAELENMKKQMNQQSMQPTNLTQNFQLAPNNSNGMRFANSIDEVQKSVITMDTPFFSNDMSVLWIKNAKGEIKSYEINEIIPKDEKDMQIELLIAQVNELKGMIQNERINANDIKSENATDTSTNDESTGSTIKENKSTSISRISKSKK
jgi:hypothetical protein